MPGVAWEGVVAGRQEGAELLRVEEALEVTVYEGVLEALEVTVYEGVLEALVVVAAVVVAAEDSEEVMAVSEAHNTSNAQHLFSPTVLMRQHCCTSERKDGGVAAPGATV